VKQQFSLIIKIAVLAITILYNFSSLSAEYISKITIQGNSIIESPTVQSYLKLKVGEEYNLSKENEAIKSLYATSLFENIRTKFLNGNLIVTVSETPFITKVLFKGNSKIKTGMLSKELLTVSGESMSNAKIQLDVEKIKEIYKRSGRFSTIVTVKIEELKNSRVQVIFDITEGPKTIVKQIYFNGNNNYSNNELMTVIITKQSRWFNFLETNNTYDPNRIEQDKELLKEFYQSVGFADFRVISATAELNPTKEYFTVTYSIEEGEKYNFGNITIDNKLANIDTKELLQYITVRKGDIFSIDQLNKIAEKITSYFAVHGYPNVNVYPENLKGAEHIIDVKFVIEKADKVFINQIIVSNNLKTEDKVIRREFKIDECDIFNRLYIENGDRRLRNLDYFEQILVNVTPTDKKDKYDLNIEVEEKSTSSIGFDVGYNTASGIFGGVSFLEKNLIGTGKTLNAGVQVGARSSSYTAGITEPHFLDKDLSLSTSVFLNRSGHGSSFLNQADQSYTLKSVGLRNALGYDITENISHEIDYTLKSDLLKSLTVSNSIFLNQQLGKFVTSAIGQTITYEQMDSMIVPKNGYFITGSQEFAGVGGNNKYIKNEVKAKYFKSFINNKVTLKLSGGFGNIEGMFGKVVRISDRFNLGDSSLRGFAPSGVGPREKNTGEGLGGEKYYSFSTELNFPTGLPQEFNLTGAVFMDCGSLWGIGLDNKSVYKADSFWNKNSLRVSLGVGLIWVTRFAPIRVDWAYPIKREPYDVKQLFNIRFSTHF